MQNHRRGGTVAGSFGFDQVLEALEEYVHFCGRVHHSEILEYHKEADIFALACVKGKDGNMDGIPVALMEAMAMEIPVVTTNVSGIPELVESGATRDS